MSSSEMHDQASMQGGLGRIIDDIRAFPPACDREEALPVMSPDDIAFMQETFERYLRLVASTGEEPVLQHLLRITILETEEIRMRRLSLAGSRR